MAGIGAYECFNILILFAANNCAIHEVAKSVMAEKKTKIAYSVGTMIEVPRGALTADEIAHTAEFISFGTNDLTQTALGMSRDDSGSFLPGYAELEIVEKKVWRTATLHFA